LSSNHFAFRDKSGGIIISTFPLQTSSEPESKPLANYKKTFNVGLKTADEIRFPRQIKLWISH